MNKKSHLILSILTFTAVVCSATGKYDGKKILFIDSYHEGYAWSDGVTNGIKKAVGNSGGTLEILRMDTKRNGDEKFKLNAGLKAKEKADAFKPDVIIASDDNAAKFTIVPYFKDKTIPVVFCGINWDASAYGFPCSNVTGMLEVSPAKILLDYLKTYAKGTIIGAIGPNNETYTKEIDNIRSKFGLDIKSFPVKTMEEWKKTFLDLQNSVNMLIVENNAGIEGWNDAEAKSFVVENTLIPTGTMLDFMAPYALIGFTRSPEEQGEWAGVTALKILDGTKPSGIPVETNKKGELFLNMKIAQKLGITFELNLVKHAKELIK